MGGLGLLAGLSIFVTVIAVGFSVLIAVALAYIALRVQDARKPEPDPRLGMKTAFHVIHTGGILLILTGLSVFMIDMMEGTLEKQPVPPPNQFGPGPVAQKKDDSFNATQRAGVALVASGGLFSVAFWAFLLGTNDSTNRSVRRVFVGGRMALCLLVTMITVTGLLVVLIQKEPEHKAAESLLAILLVWFPGACIHLVLFFANMTESRTTRRVGEERGWRPADD